MSTNIALCLHTVTLVWLYQSRHLLQDIFRHIRHLIKHCLAKDTKILTTVYGLAPQLVLPDILVCLLVSYTADNDPIHLRQLTTESSFCDNLLLSRLSRLSLNRLMNYIYSFKLLSVEWVALLVKICLVINLIVCPPLFQRRRYPHFADGGF